MTKSIASLDEEGLELISARFADLIAQEYQQRLLDQVCSQLFQSQHEDEFAHTLLRALAQRCGEPDLLYIGLSDSGVGPVVPLGRPAPTLELTPSRSLLEAGQSYLIPGNLMTLALGHKLSAADGIRLRDGKGCPIGLVTLERHQDGALLRDFLEKLGERASQALVSLRLREAVEQLRRTIHKQRQHSQQQTRLLNLMDDWNQMIHRLESRFQHLEQLLKTAVDTLGGQKGSLMLLDEPKGELVVRAIYGLQPEIQERIRRGDQPCRRLKLGEGVAGRVMQTLQPMLVNRVDQEPLFLEPELSQVSSIVCLPLHVEGLPLGVINITNREQARHFLPEQLDEGMKLADQAARAINHSRLYHLAILDPVTEVFSRTHLFQRIHDELVRARRYQRNLCLLALTLLGLEVVRTHQGNESAHQLEITFTGILRECVRETDIVAQLGEDSYAVLMPETDAMAGVFAAERICLLALENELLAGYRVTAHVGVCSYPDRAEHPLKLLARAESAMNMAARSGESLPVVLAPAVGLVTENSAPAPQNRTHLAS